jgi:SAM-dependent methyltransferase
MVAKKSLPLSWHEEESGTQFLKAEKSELEAILPTLYGYHLVFVGESALAPLVESSLITHQILVNEHKQGARGKLSYLQAAGDSLPLQNESVDVVVLSHTLEHASNPHDVLREAHRVLIPEGHVVITGFNPVSMWGVWHSWKQFRGATPEQGRMLTNVRVRDWLTLLNFQTVRESGFYFRPPMAQSPFYEKLEFLERWGRKWWPFCAGAYTLLAVKRVVPLTPIRARWRLEKRLWHPAAAAEGLPKPTTTSQGCHVKNRSR